MKSRIVLATRKSTLAMIQARQAQAALQRARPDLVVELAPMSTQGDERLTWSLEKEGGKGLFTSELERAVLQGEADYAIHSGKDLPTAFDEGLELSGFLPREDPRDVLVFREELPGGEPQRIASGSPRRRAQVRNLFPEAAWSEIRGNVETRLRKIAEGEADATILAAAGLTRLGIRGHPGLSFFILPVEECVPATAQGAIAIQGRTGEAALWEGCICPLTTHAVTLERRTLAALGGGCHNASAAFVADGTLHLFDEALGRHQVQLEGDETPDVEAFINALRTQIQS